MGEIDRDALLARVQPHEVAALIGTTRLQLDHRIADLVAFVRPFDLDDPRAEVCQQPRAVGPREHSSEIDDDDTGEQGLASGWIRRGQVSGRRKCIMLRRSLVLAIYALTAIRRTRSAARGRRRPAPRAGVSGWGAQRRPLCPASLLLEHL